jgi:hypothetical protein
MAYAADISETQTDKCIACVMALDYVIAAISQIF